MVMSLRRQYFSQSELLPNWTCGHFWMANVWLPNSLKLFSTFRSSTRMAVITTMMEKTPMSTPSSVSAERNGCARMAFMAMEKLSRISPNNKVGGRNFIKFWKHSTFNIQHPTPNEFPMRAALLDVRC